MALDSGRGKLVELGRPAACQSVIVGDCGNEKGGRGEKWRGRKRRGRREENLRKR